MKIKKILLFIFVVIISGMMIQHYLPRQVHYYKLEKGKKELKEQVEKIEDETEKYLRKAKVYYEKEEYLKAKNELRQLVKKHPSSDKANMIVALMAQIEKGYMNQKAGNEAKQRRESEAKKKRAKKALKKMGSKKDWGKGITWYRAKGSPVYANENGIFLYFIKKDRLDYATNLRLKIQYHAETRLDIEYYQFNIDGNVHIFAPDEVKSGAGTGYVWEWSDSKVTGDLFKIISAIAVADSANYRIIGRDNFRIRKIEHQEKTAIRDVLIAYEALGGTFAF